MGKLISLHTDCRRTRLGEEWPMTEHESGSTESTYRSDASSSSRTNDLPNGIENRIGARSRRSLEDVHSSVAVEYPRFWKRLFAFLGPAYLISVGYMDPGNWATDIEGGAR